MTIPLPEGAAWREFEASEMWHRHRLQTDGSRSSWQCNPAERDYAMYLRSLFSRLFQQMAEIPVAALLSKPLKRLQILCFLYPTATCPPKCFLYIGGKLWVFLVFLFSSPARRAL